MSLLSILVVTSLVLVAISLYIGESDRDDD
jgi:hypothetical protein